MIDKDKALIYIHGTKHPLYDWDEEELNQKVEDFIQQQNNYDFKLVIAYTIYNEEDFLEDSLNSCLNINDLDGIHLLDGAWIDGGDNGVSTDNTKTIIEKFKKEHPEIKVVFEYPNHEIWKTQPEKRNHSLDRIEEIWGKSYIIVKDGDETFKFNSGRDNIWLKKEITAMWPALGIINTYAYNGSVPMLGARIFPTGQGTHYDTERNMVIHDKNCNILCDYNVDKEFVQYKACFEIKYMFYVNYWTARNLKRMEKKDDYTEIIRERREKDDYKECQYKRKEMIRLNQQGYKRSCVRDDIP